MLSLTPEYASGYITQAGTANPVVLEARRQELLQRQQPAKIGSLAFLAIGGLLTITIIGAILGIPMLAIAGWVHDPRSPSESLEAQLFIDDKLAAMELADGKRPDLVESGVTANPDHGFDFDLTPLNLPPGRHTAQVYALRQAAGANKILLPVAKQPSVFEVSHERVNREAK